MCAMKEYHAIYVLLQLLAASLYSEIYQFLNRDIVVRFSIPDFVL